MRSLNSLCFVSGIVLSMVDASVETYRDESQARRNARAHARAQGASVKKRNKSSDDTLCSTLDRFAVK